ncbi:PEGA domain-containing protein [Pseudenhygromyxa sp. WMMC2535]|uniref:PEGA domain-containing protein n=1 Tax=Pseudenhygromyxa sp. WMMC2535 TaxID=2712867 RepID=UPI001556A541|nr:PEGA domain-containing protein [Pseudenhygromyxa sp. WMMC2535]NVB39100.1 PEGA domain-containing protein [Pseudenhygromyxa sp. WMMC2535]
MIFPAARLRSPAAIATALALGLATIPGSAMAAPPNGEPEADMEAGGETSEAPSPAPSTPPAPKVSKEDGTRAAILPLVVSGQLLDNDRQTLTDALVEGLQRGNFDVVPPDAVIAAGHRDCSRAGCMQSIASSTGASHVVRVVVEVVDRDYSVQVELYDGKDGTTVVTSSDGCEICGVADVSALLSTQAATLRTKLDALSTGPAAIVVTSTPEGAEVTLDGEPYGVTPLDKPVIPGDHVIRVSAEGYISMQEKRTFVEGARETLSYELEKVPNRLPKRPWGWAALGVGVAALGVSIGMAAGLHGRVEYTVAGNCEGNDKDSDDNCRYLWDTMAISLPTGIVGGALTTLGVAILINTAKNPHKKAKRQAATAHIQASPGGLSLRF